MKIIHAAGLALMLTGKVANFSALLVYDVSPWGRFQDVDESTYYKYVLKRVKESLFISVRTAHAKPALD
jgi:hypothetical protein